MKGKRDEKKREKREELIRERSGDKVNSESAEKENDQGRGWGRWESGNETYIGRREKKSENREKKESQRWMNGASTLV